MSNANFADKFVRLAIAELKKMPCLWFNDDEADNAWEMLVSIGPEGLPEMGVGDEILRVIVGWIDLIGQKQVPSEIQEHWADHTPEGLDFHYDKMAYEDRRDVLDLPSLEEISRAVAAEILPSVMHVAERENYRRLEE